MTTGEDSACPVHAKPSAATAATPDRASKTFCVELSEDASSLSERVGWPSLSCSTCMPIEPSAATMSSWLSS